MNQKKRGYYTLIMFRLSALSLMLVASWLLSAQPYDILKQLEGYKTRVYFSTGNEIRAKILAERLDKVYDFYQEKISFEPKVTMVILNQQDWGKFTTFPVYGMPHYDEKRDLLIVASENNDFWRSFIPDLDQLPRNQANEISSTYTDGDQSLTMQPFFDLLAIHEIGHAYHIQAGLTMQRKWIAELFCNFLLHTYVAENEPEQLAALTIFPQMVIHSGSTGYKYTSLKDIEEKYDEIGRNHAKNYGWYQSRWHASAGQIYDSAGVMGLSKLWNAFMNQRELLSDADLVTFLAEVHQSIADVIITWDNNKPE